MASQRAAKRARKACLNCRRKKARCSGERPVCDFCSRLGQECTWDQEWTFQPSPTQDVAGISDADLTARVALLEDRLSHIRQESFQNIFGALPCDWDISLNLPLDPSLTFPPSMTDASTPTEFSGLPDKTIMTSLIDTYFIYCHNQPYAYFHEASFRQRFENDEIPEYLLNAFVATASRFSDLPIYEGKQAEAMSSYGNASWSYIIKQSFSEESRLDCYMVQATNMLAAIDFNGMPLSSISALSLLLISRVAGHPKRGWIKFALSVRFAQSLHLNEEPDPDLPVWQQEEQRRTFWSVYLLDHLISLGHDRLPSFLEADITVQLPGPERLFREGLPAGPVPTLETVIESSPASTFHNLDYFAMTVLMASALGRFVRFSMKRTPKNKYVPWDPRSNYHAAHSLLLFFECHLASSCTALIESLGEGVTQDNLLAQQPGDHFFYSQAIFHILHCLINHPFVLYHLFQQCSAAIPLSFVEEALQRCYKHATHLLDLLDDAQRYGQLLNASFFGYCAMQAGVIHRLLEYHEDPEIAASSTLKVQQALEYLERPPVRWLNQLNMVSYEEPQ